MIDVDSLSKRFGSRTLWHDLKFSVGQGEMLALVGPSGSGKSTLLNCMGLLDRPTEGAVHYEGRDITRFSRREARLFRRDVLGYLFQHYALIENATVEENLDVVTKPRQPVPGRPGATIAEALDRVGLGGREEEQVNFLSGGEQQRVAVARLLVQQPALVLADEPTAALDSANAAMVLSMLREMSVAGCTVVIATHDDTVRDACDSVFDVHESTDRSFV
ncbi:ABC transporter ATP-binding protein [Streptomyces sp. CH-036]|uniref:ABC transporter ATP-binding protein n=1 Tax=Streptomyces sp. CH-036 TaxID=3406733 RepID=UPI003C785B58